MFFLFVGVSHSGSATKDKDNLVDEGHVGQFHKVLVEPEYCLPGPPTVSDDPHNSATLRIGKYAYVFEHAMQNSNFCHKVLLYLFPGI